MELDQQPMKAERKPLDFRCFVGRRLVAATFASAEVSAAMHIRRRAAEGSISTFEADQILRVGDVPDGVGIELS